VIRLLPEEPEVDHDGKKVFIHGGGTSRSAFDRFCSLFAKDPKLSGAPEYNTPTAVHLRAVVSEVKVTPEGQAMAGVHLFVKNGGEILDVFLGPSQYIKIFNLPLNPGDRVEVLGSEVKFKGANMILGREVTKGAVTMILRDDSGTPMWNDWMDD
jgi:hypothetical protein